MESDLTTELVKWALAIAAPIVSAFLVAIMVKVFQKLGLQIDAGQQMKLQSLAQQAILSSEEWAAAKIKANFTVTAKMKLERALTTMLDKVPGISTEEAALLIEAELPKLNLGATQFVRAAREAATTGGAA